MTDKTPPDWVLIEAAKRCGREGTKPEVILDRWYSDAALRALCDMIERYEQPPVDRKLLCAMEVFGEHDVIGHVKAVRAIELFEQGFGE